MVPRGLPQFRVDDHSSTWPIFSGFLGFCQDKIQGHSSTFQGLNLTIQGLSEWGQMNLLMCKLKVLINIFASVVDKCRY